MRNESLWRDLRSHWKQCRHLVAVGQPGPEDYQEKQKARRDRDNICTALLRWTLHRSAEEDRKWGRMALGDNHFQAATSKLFAARDSPINLVET